MTTIGLMNGAAVRTKPLPTVPSNVLGISVSYQRRDTKQFSCQHFFGWDNAIKFARWVLESPELELLNLELAEHKE